MVYLLPEEATRRTFCLKADKRCLSFPQDDERSRGHVLLCYVLIRGQPLVFCDNPTSSVIISSNLSTSKTIVAFISHPLKNHGSSNSCREGQGQAPGCA